MKKIGIFGISADPPHASHKAIIEACLKKKLVNEVWVLPSDNHTQKKNIASFGQRIEMCKLMFKSWKYPIIVKDFELYNNSGTTLRMINRLEFLFKKYKFYFIAGEDQADNIETWYSYKELIEKYPFIVFQRGDYVSKNPKDWYLSKPHTVVSIEGCGISSTQVRRAINQSLYNLAETMTNDEVVRYILGSCLYENGQY
jgi:nicotinate (nicotinamide) nucleotide adenylyltransferase